VPRGHTPPGRVVASCVTRTFDRGLAYGECEKTAVTLSNTVCDLLQLGVERGDVVV
jgi:hypothetical protein